MAVDQVFNVAKDFSSQLQVDEQPSMLPISAALMLPIITPPMLPITTPPMLPISAPLKFSVQSVQGLLKEHTYARIEESSSS